MEQTVNLGFRLPRSVASRVVQDASRVEPKSASRSTGTKLGLVKFFSSAGVGAGPRDRSHYERVTCGRKIMLTLTLKVDNIGVPTFVSGAARFVYLCIAVPVRST